jgi:hypothetical protein
VVCTKNKITPASFLTQFDSSIEISLSTHGNDIEIERESAIDYFFLNPGGYDEALALGVFAVGQGAYWGRSANSFDDVLGELHYHSPRLSTKEKLLILKEVGARLSALYDYSLQNQNGPNDLFLNARGYGSRGGICGDIHHYLSEVANALGFQDAGTHTLQWFKNEQGVGHFVSHFKDPETGKYFIQNYTTIVATNAKNLATAVDVSTRIHGPLTNLSLVEGRPGIFHAYTPDVAQWIYGQVDRLLSDKNKKSKVIIELSPENKYIGLKLVSSSQIGMISGFVLSDQQQSDSGRYQVSIIGIELSNNFEKSHPNGVKTGTSSFVRIGGVSLETPNRDPYLTGYADVSAIGYARLNQTTGEIELTARTTDTHFSDGAAPLVKMKLRLAQDFGDHTKFEVERTYVGTRGNYDYIDVKAGVESDRIAIIIDAQREGQEKAYLRFQGDYYFLEGVDARSAHAVRFRLQGVLPERILNGEVHIFLDVSRILSNPQSDALYRYFDKNTAVSLKISWEKQVKSKVIVGVSGEVNNGRPYPGFQDNLQRLSSQSEGREYRWMVFLRVIL